MTIVSTVTQISGIKLSLAVGFLVWIIGCLLKVKDASRFPHKNRVQQGKKGDGGGGGDGGTKNLDAHYLEKRSLNEKILCSIQCIYNRNFYFSLCKSIPLVYGYVERGLRWVALHSNIYSPRRTGEGELRKDTGARTQLHNTHRSKVSKIMSLFYSYVETQQHPSLLASSLQPRLKSLLQG